MDRRDLLAGINDFLSDSMVLPPGEYDKELLLPIIETAKMKTLNANKRTTAYKSQNSNQSTDSQQQKQAQTQCKCLIFEKLRTSLIIVFFL